MRSTEDSLPDRPEAPAAASSATRCAAPRLIGPGERRAMGRTASRRPPSSSVRSPRLRCRAQRSRVDVSVAGQYVLTYVSRSGGDPVMPVALLLVHVQRGLQPASQRARCALNPLGSSSRRSRRRGPPTTCLSSTPAEAQPLQGRLRTPLARTVADRSPCRPRQAAP